MRECWEEWDWQLGNPWELMLGAVGRREDPTPPTLIASLLAPMSGRLVILKHKSWNVWNQDNRERVLRDERIHREEEAAAQADKRKRTRSQIYNQLHGSEHDSDLPNNKVDRASYQNPEFIREKEQQDQLKRRREGLAEWQLGKGAFESKADQLWYNQTAKANIEDPKISILHQSEDPMKKFVNRTESWVQIESKQDEEESESLENNRPKSSHRKEDLISALRERRLQREKAESKKAAVLLARADIYGQQRPPSHPHSSYPSSLPVRPISTRQGSR
jgi:hypothetical protein